MFTKSNPSANFIVRTSARRHCPNIVELRESEKKEKLEQRAKQLVEEQKAQHEELKTNIAKMFLAGPDAWPDYEVNVDDIPYDPEIEDEEWVPLEYNQDSYIEE